MEDNQSKTKFTPRWQKANAHSLPNMYQAMLLQVGVSGPDTQKPIIGIANSWSEVVPGEGRTSFMERPLTHLSLPIVPPPRGGVKRGPDILV